MTFHATTRVTVLSDKTTTDEYGDEKPSYDVVDSNVRAHIAEKSRSLQDQQSGVIRAVKIFEALLPHGQSVSIGYRLKDEKSEVTYLVEYVEVPAQFVGGSPVRAELKIVT